MPSRREKGILAMQKSGNLKETTSTASHDWNWQNRDSPKSQGLSNFRSLESNKPKKLPNGRQKLQIDDFQVLKRLGQGKFGKVYLIKQKRTGMLLAMKVIKKQKILQSGLLCQFIRQLKIQSFLQHPNIIKIYGIFHDKISVYTLLELGCDGQLYTFMTNNKICGQEVTSFICKNLLNAINYMHGMNVLHRDIKPENIVLIHGAVKLCDFGWAVNKKTKEDLRSTFCGTPLYLSPELLTGAYYDEKVDIWAIGILTYEMVYEKSPFQIENQTEIHRIVTKDVFYPKNRKVSREFKTFISAVLRKNPNDRPNGEELLDFQFIKNYLAMETCEELCQ